jgi:hypothetical protein
MTVSGQTLTKIQLLARLVQTGYQSNVVDATLDKLIVMERARLEIEAESLAGQLRPFEQRYQLPSAEFHRRFRAGEMGDDADMFEWSAFYQMWLSVQERLEALRPERSL